LTLSAAYSKAVAGDIIRARSAGFMENLVLDRAIAIKLEGGYDATQADNPGDSTLEGVLTVQRGSSIIDKVVIR
jgi:hypothetical protein